MHFPVEEQQALRQVLFFGIVTLGGRKQHKSTMPNHLPVKASACARADAVLPGHRDRMGIWDRDAAAHSDDLETKIRDCLPWEQKAGANGKHHTALEQRMLQSCSAKPPPLLSSVPADGWAHVLDTQSSAAPAQQQGRGRPCESSGSALNNQEQNQEFSARTREEQHGDGRSDAPTSLLENLRDLLNKPTKAAAPCWRSDTTLLQPRNTYE